MGATSTGSNGALRPRVAASILVAIVAALPVGAPASTSAAPASIALPPPRDLASAVEAIEQATGTKAEPLEGAAGTIPLPKGRSFVVDAKTGARLLAGSHESYRRAGFYLFRTERAYGMEGEKDRIALLATADRAEVVRRIGTAGPNRGVTPEAIVAWLEALEKDEPFELLEVGTDYVAGRFRQTPKDPMAIAKRCAEIAPALSANSTKMLDLLAEEIRANRTLYLFW